MEDPNGGRHAGSTAFRARFDPLEEIQRHSRADVVLVPWGEEAGDVAGCGVGTLGMAGRGVVESAGERVV